MFFRRNFAARTRDRETECCYLQNNIGSNSTKTQRFIYLYPTAFIKCNFARTRYCICSSHTRCWIYSIVNLYLFIYFACTRTDVGFSFFFPPFFFFFRWLSFFRVLQGCIKYELHQVSVLSCFDEVELYITAKSERPSCSRMDASACRGATRI